MSHPAKKKQRNGGGVPPTVWGSLGPPPTRLDLLNKACRQAGIALAEKTEIHGKGVGRLQHPPQMPRSRGASRGSGAGRRPGSATHHGGEARIQRLLDLLWRDEMYMHVDTAGRHNLTFARDHLGSRPDNDVDVRLHVRITGFPDSGNQPVLDADIGLNDPPVIENQRVSDHRIERALAAGTLRLAHAIPDHFPASELHLLAIASEILLHLDDELGIREAHLVAYRRTEHLRVRSATHGVWHSRFLRARR